MSDEFYRADISFKVDGEPVAFTIYHNTIDFISDALTSWLYRTEEYTAESLCEYIKSKNIPSYVVFTQEEYEAVLKK